jgi:hypothetical protein
MLWLESAGQGNYQSIRHFENLKETLHHFCPNSCRQAAGQARGGGLPRSRESRPGCGFRCCAMRPSHCCDNSHARQLSSGTGGTSPLPGFSQPPCAVNFIGNSGQLSEENTRNDTMAVIRARPVCGNEDERGIPMLLPAFSPSLGHGGHFFFF